MWWPWVAVTIFNGFPNFCVPLDKETALARLRVQEETRAPNYILVLTEHTATQPITTIVDPTGPNYLVFFIWDVFKQLCKAYIGTII